MKYFTQDNDKNEIFNIYKIVTITWKDNIGSVEEKEI